MAWHATRFETEMWHPNIYPDGRVCISILHPPGTDRFNDQAVYFYALRVSFYLYLVLKI